MLSRQYLANKKANPFKKNRSDLIFVTQLKVKLLTSLHRKNDFAERSKILLQI